MNDLNDLHAEEQRTYEAHMNNLSASANAYHDPLIHENGPDHVLPGEM